MLKMTTIRYSLTPFIAPASPAIVSGVNLYNELRITGWTFGLAFVASILLGLTIELSGAYAAKGFTDFWGQADWYRMIIAGFGLLFYTIVGVSFVWGTHLVWVILLTLSIYLTIAAQDTRREKAESSQVEADTELQIAKQKASIARAEARTAQFSAFAPENGAKMSEINPEVRKYLDTFEAPDKVTLADICQNCGIKSTSTASKHKSRYILARKTQP